VIIVDRALARRAEANDPVRVGMVGAGFMGRGIARQILNSVPGMQLAAVANRQLDMAERAYREAGADDVEAVEIDVVIEVTGAVEFGAGVVLDTIEHGKHVVACGFGRIARAWSTAPATATSPAFR
jgi:predicted homoserine dehydrogenase-like protein